MNDKIFITKEKEKELQEEIKVLIDVKRKEIADKLEWYRDNIEDEETHSAFSEVLEEKGLMEEKIREIKEILTEASIIGKVSTDTISIGNKVKIKIGSKEVEYMIVSEIEADPAVAKISNKSPIGSVLLGKTKGDEVEVETPGGKKKYKIIGIS